MNHFQALKDRAAFIDKELINLTNSTNSFFDTTTETPNIELSNYLADLKSFDNDLQEELDLQRKTLQRSKDQVRDMKETLHKLDNLISTYNHEDSSLSNLSVRFSPAKLQISEIENDDNVEGNCNGQLNGFQSVDVDNLLNQTLPQL